MSFQIQTGHDTPPGGGDCRQKSECVFCMRGLAGQLFRALSAMGNDERDAYKMMDDALKAYREIFERPCPTCGHVPKVT
jgi:hypothetical protein